MRFHATRGLRDALRVPLALIVLAFAANLLLEVTRVSAAPAWPYPTVPVLMMSLLPLLALEGLVWSVTGSMRVTGSLTLGLAAAFGLVNRIKLNLRDEPVYPSDLTFLRQGRFLLEMLRPSQVAFICFAVLTMSALPFLLGRLAHRPRPSAPRHRHRASARLVTGTLCCLLVHTMAGFNDSGNAARELYEKAGAVWQPWNQKYNYGINGVVAGFLWNLETRAMAPPPGYDRATMMRIADRWKARADIINADRDASALDGVNVVVVLGETFSDPLDLSGVTIPQDPIPRTRALMRTTLSGKTLSRNPGGGTANMEFESLTGMSVAQFDPTMTTPYQMLVPRFPTFPSAVGYLRAQGHRTIAIHPSSLSTYRRSDVYPRLGFDSAIGAQDMQHTSVLEHNPFISDASAFDEVMDTLRETSQPALVNLVTIQNHFPMAGKYAHPIDVPGLSGDARAQAGGFLRGLSYTDEALGDFVTRLRDFDEPTVVVFYGDHRPGFWPMDVQGDSGPLTMRTTPYFLWNNRATARLRPDPADAVLSPIYFLPRTLDMLNAPLPPYYALLDALSHEVPAMEGDLFVTRDGVTSRSALAPAARALLRDYRLVQYDLSVGHRYVQQEMFPQSFPPMPGSVTSATH